MSAVETTIISILIMILAGYILKKIKVLSFKDAYSLNNLVIYLLMPCMIFNSLYHADMNVFPKLAIMPIIGLICGGLTGLILFVILTIIKFPKVKKWSVLITVILGNTAFLGFPVILGIYGQTALINAIFYDMASLISFLSLSVILMFIFEGKFKEVIKKVLSFPVLWAVILGICLNVFNLPIGEIANNVIVYFGLATIPLIMLVLGLSLDFNELKENIKISVPISLFKLFVTPAICCVVISLIGLNGLDYTVAIVEASMPAGMLNLILAIKYKLEYRLTTDCLFLSSLFCLITIPLVINVFHLI
ncbi:AEC family transporter [Methanobrevibacter curvatus]|uniref:Membrane transport protein n=1 Tax=Methanobrevibacter curvatus TaxID=49547 RepID=A0A166C6I0_9EURY|nr:AEC family transporter [Methanobrevibacter curvatus]KZX11667.1 membrane transport protein [Methanobrevibacter curvatus]